MAQPQYSIGTLVTNPQLYADMKSSFERGGFIGDVEWLTIDNTSPDQTDAYKGLNTLLDRAAGRFVILCHQDLLLLDDTRAILDARLAALSAHAPDWGLAGNAGGDGARHVVRRISDPHGDNQCIGSFPHRVQSLDENFIVVRADARLSFSRDLGGFHLYGTDICLIADVLGYSAWVIDFHLRHLSGGTLGATFAASEVEFRRKWRRALRDRDVQSTCTFVSLSGRARSAWATRTRETLLLKAGRLRRSLGKRSAAKTTTP